MVSLLVRSVFKSAFAASPSIIFLDEMEALVGNRSLGKSQGDVVQERILSTLLNEMDGIETAGNVLVLVRLLFKYAGCHQPTVYLLILISSDLIDIALLRPGRFDRAIYVTMNFTNIDSRPRSRFPPIHFKAIHERNESK